MKRLVALVVVGGLWVHAASAQQLAAADCVHLNYPGHFTDILKTPTKVYGPVVPLNEVWIVETADVYTPGIASPAPGQEFMLEVIEPLTDELGVRDSSGDDVQVQMCCIRVAVARASNVTATPFLALPHSLLLRPGQRLAARTNTPYTFGITATMTRYPGLCQAALQWGR